LKFEFFATASLASHSQSLAGNEFQEFTFRNDGDPEFFGPGQFGAWMGSGQQEAGARADSFHDLAAALFDLRGRQRPGIESAERTGDHPGLSGERVVDHFQAAAGGLELQPDRLQAGDQFQVGVAAEMLDQQPCRGFADTFDPGEDLPVVFLSAGDDLFHAVKAVGDQGGRHGRGHALKTQCSQDLDKRPGLARRDSGADAGDLLFLETLFPGQQTEIEPVNVGDALHPAAVE
jgi:hypothetical protein